MFAKLINNRCFNTPVDLPPKYVTLDMFNMRTFRFGLPGITAPKTKKLPKNDFSCSFEVSNTVISWKSTMRYTHIEYI